MDDDTPSPTNPGPPGHTERWALRLSMWAGGSIGVIGIVWGITSGSQMILFDGAFALFGIVLTLVTLLVLRMVEAGPSPRFPFGHESLTPLVIGLQGLVLLAVCGYAVVEAVSTINAGGSEIAPGWAIAYAAVSLTGSIGVWAWMRPVGRRSELIAAEATQWLATCAFGVGMLVGFGAILLAEGTSWESASRYVDPTMVIVAGVVVLPTPVRLIRTMAAELFEAVPPADVGEPIRDAVDVVMTEAGIAGAVTLMTKVGRKLYLEVDVVVDPSFTVAEVDRIRHDILGRLADLPVEVWLNAEFTADPGLLA